MPRIEEKQSVIKTIKDSIEGATSIVLVDYRGLSVEQDTELRKSLREANVTYKVFKNSMMSFAFQGTEFEALDKHLAGPSAIAISYEDPTAGPRVLLKQSKAFKNLEFKAGVVEGIYYDDAMIVKIAAIPSREELLSKLLGSIKSPISTFARTIKAVADKAAETGAATAAGLVSDSVAEVVEPVAEPVAEVVEEVAVETEVTTEEKIEE
ncbi:MAG: 50S ribosomal protein L10 [Vallitaleaceae bacterium]|nr:50S ribosomal protein L10 [Vallitaleaceae bacterium]